MRALTLGLIALVAFGQAACDDDDDSTARQGTDDAGAFDGGLADRGAPDGEDAAPLDPDADAPDAAPPDAEAPDAAPPPPGPFRVRGTVEQIYVWDAPTDTELEVLGPDGEVFAEGPTDMLGSKVFRGLPPADGYTVRLADAPDEAVDDITVLEVDFPPPSDDFYDQVLQPGFGYMTMRDGTKLSIFVSLPGPPEDGPYPTLVNYSGYSPSKPGEVVSDAVRPLCNSFPVLCDAPGHPAGLIAGVAGYATVGVNMRGTGCSGGAYDYFEPLQLMDGHDAIEIVARQPWVMHGKVGMAGLSYPGISQLFVAKTRPPSLAAITPMSVIADSASSTLAPGGIYNSGFALAWIENVLDRARPYGHRWIEDVVEAGDTVCEEHQLLHGQKLDVVAKALANPYYTDEVAKPVDPSSFVDVVDVPVYLSGQWQDEQTGPHFAALLDKFTASPSVRFVLTNGVHSDGYTPQNLMEWFIFNELYVARRVPYLSDEVLALVPFFFSQRFGVNLTMPPNRFADYDDYAQALADYEAEPIVRLTFDSGGDPELAPGAPQGTFIEYFDAWPIPETTPWRLWLTPEGTLADAAPGPDGGESTFAVDPEAGDRVTLPGGGIDDLQPDYDYRPLDPDHALAWIGAPLDADRVLAGSGSVDLWIRSTADDADLEVNLTEVRPDGDEMHVQSGWLRASHRALREDATELRPVKTHREADAAPLVPGEWTLVRVEIMPFAHVFRAGSRLRLSVDTPGDSRAEWRFLLLDHDDTVQHTVGHDDLRPSSVVLPWIPDVEVPTPAPTCGALRGQPCRPYAPLPMEPNPGN